MNNNQVQIVIKAQDQASAIVQQVRVGLNMTALAAESAASKTLLLGTAIAHLGGSSLASVSQLTASLTALKSTISGIATYDIGGITPLDIIKQKAQDAISETASLKDIISTVSESKLLSTKGIFSNQSIGVKGDLDKQFDGVAAKLSGALVKGLNQVPIANIPLVNKLFSQSQVPALIGSLDKSISDIILNQTIGKKLPGVLQSVVGFAFGQDLTETIGNSLRSPRIQGVVNKIFDEPTKEILKGSAIGALEKKVAQFVSQGFAEGLVKSNSLVGKVTLGLGQKLAGEIFAGDKNKGVVKNLFGSDISQKLDTILPDLAKKLSQASGIAKGVESVAGELTLLTAGSLSALGGGAGLGFLLGGAQGAAAGAGFASGAVDNIMTEMFRAADKSMVKLIPGLSNTFQTGLLSGMGAAFIKATQLPKLAEIGLSIAIQGTLKKAIEGGLGEISRFPEQIGAILYSKLPPQLQGVFGFIEATFPGKVAALKNSVTQSFLGFGESILKPLITSPIQQTQAEIKRLTAIANNEIAEGYRATADKLETEYKVKAQKTLETVKQLRQQFNQSATKAQDTTLSDEDRQKAAGEAIGAKSQLDRIVQQNKQDFGGIRDLRQKADKAEVNLTDRTKAISDAKTLRVELENNIKLIEREVNTLEARKQSIAASSLPLEEQQKLIAEINAEINKVKAPFQTPVEKLAQSISSIFRSLVEGNSNFGQSLQQAFESFDEFSGGALTDLKGIFLNTFGEISNTATKSFGSGLFQGILVGLAPALEEIDAFVVQSINKIKKIPQTLSQPLDVGAKGAAFLVGVNEPLQLFGAIQSGAAKAFEGVSAIGQQITFFSSGLQTLQQLVANGPFKLLIGQNITLKEQLLATQTSLAATNKVVGQFSGTEYSFSGKDPTAPIKALGKPVEDAIAKVRLYSLELSGVTSGQLIESFQIIAGQAGAIGVSLDQAAQLTKSFAGAMGTLGIPLFQARQEITSIVMGQIDQNSMLAKSIGLTNEEVRLWKSKGTIYDNLVGRLKAFESGNAMASRTVSGFSSNIQEIFEEIGRKAGEPLLQPIVDELEKVYKFLQANMDSIASVVSEVVMKVFTGIQAVWKSLQGLVSASQGFLTTVPIYLFNSLGNALQALAKAIDFTVAILGPAIETFSKLFEAVKPLGGPLLEMAVQFKVLSVGVQTLGSGFGILGNLLPGIGELLFGINMRMLPMLNMFPQLAGTVGTGAAGFLLLGQNMNAIPGLSGMVSGALGPIGPLVAGLLPTVAGFGVTVLGVAKMVPFLDNALKGLFAANPGVLAQGLATVAKTIPALAPFSPLLDQMAARTLVAANGMTIAEIATSKFQAGVELAKIKLRQFIVSTALMAAGLFAAFYAFDNFILKNKAVMDTLAAVADGIKTTAEVLFSLATNPVILGFATILGLLVIQASGIYIVLLKIIGVQLASWAIGAAAALDKVAKVMGVLKVLDNVGSVGAFGKLTPMFTSMAGGASRAAVGLRAMGTFMTQGSAAAATLLVNAGLLPAATTAAGGAAAASAGGFTVMATAIWSAVAGLVALLAPFIAVAAAIGAIGLYVYSKQMEDSTKATEVYGETTDAVFSSALSVAQKLKKAKEQQSDKVKNGIKLSKEEYEQNKLLLRQAKNQENLLNGQIETLKTAQKEAKGEGNKNAIEAQIQSLERAKKLLATFSGDVQIAPKELPRLGTMFEQLAQKAKSAEEAIKNSSGDSAIFKQKVQELMEVTQTELKAGKITETEARRRLALITNNTAVEADLQIKAQEAITEAFKSETQKQIEAKDVQLAEIEALAASGEITEVEAAKRTTEAKNAQLKLQLEEAERVHKKKMELLDEELKKTIANLTAQLNAKTAEAYKEPAGKKRDDKLAEAAAIYKQIEVAQKAHQSAVTETDRQGENERDKLKAEQKKSQAEGNKRIQDAELKQLEKTQKKAIDTAVAADNDLLIQKKELLKNGEISQAEYDEAAANSTVDRTKAELAAEETKLKELEQKVKNAPDAKTRKELEEQIRASKLKTQDLTKGLLDGEQKAYESHINTIRSVIERDQTKANIDIEKSINAGTKSQVDADAARAAQTVERLQKEIAAETVNKDKRLKLELELQQALGKLQDAGTAQKLAALDREFTQKNIATQKGINSGKVLEETAAADRAAQQVQRLEKEIALTTRDKDKKLKLELELQQAIKSAQDARIAERLATLKRASLLEQAALQEKANKGLIVDEAVATARARAALTATQAELKEVKAGSTKYAELMLQRAEQVKGLKDAEIAEKLAALKKGELKEQIELQKGINAGTVLEETANVKKIQQQITATEAQLKLERAGTTKALELEKSKLEQLEQLRQSKIAEKLAGIKRAQLQEEAALQEGINNGSVLEETASRKRAEAELAATQAELNLTRQGTTKYYELLVQRNQKVKAVRDAQVAERLAAVDRAGIKEQIQLQKGINSGTVLEETAAKFQAEQRLKRIQEELKIQQNNAKRKLELEKEYYEAVKALQDAKIAEKQAANKRAQLVEEIGLQKAINQGIVFEEEAATKRAEMAIAATDSELALTRKNTTKYLELLKQREEQAASLKEARKNERLAALNREQLAEQIGLQNSINQGLIREERANTIRAQQTVDRIKQELALETTNRTKILELKKSLAEAEKSLQDAQLAEYKAKLDQETQAFENKVLKENQALQKQASLYDMLGKALENQSRLLNARKDLANAETEYLTNSIDLIAQSETSETKKRQLAETTAAIKLRALEQQIEYDRMSLELEQRKNKLALEREIIQNRMAQADAAVEAAKARANIASLNADPKATAEQKEAARLQLEAAVMKQDNLQSESGFLQERRAIEADLAQNEQRKFAMSAQSRRDKAQFDLINTLPPGTRNAYMRAFREGLAEREFDTTSKGLRQSGVASSRNLLKELFPDVKRGLRPNIMLEAYDPELGALTEVLSGAEAQLARSDVQSKFDTKFGDTGFTVPNAYAPPAPELKLPTNIGDRLLGQKPQLEAAKQLTLASKDIRRGTLQAPNQLNLLNRNFDELNKNIDSTGDRTFNVTVNFPGRSAEPVTKQELLASLGRAIAQAERSIA